MIFKIFIFPSISKVLLENLLYRKSLTKVLTLETPFQKRHMMPNASSLKTSVDTFENSV